MVINQELLVNLHRRSANCASAHHAINHISAEKCAHDFFVIPLTGGVCNFFNCTHSHFSAWFWSLVHLFHRGARYNIVISPLIIPELFSIWPPQCESGAPLMKSSLHFTHSTLPKAPAATLGETHTGPKSGYWQKYLIIIKLLECKKNAYYARIMYGLSISNSSF